MISDREQWQRARHLFDELVELDGASRRSRLEQICLEDPELGNAVARLLQSDMGSEGALDDYSFGSGGASQMALFLAFQEAVAGRYSIVREIGRGGMGIVYLAREVRLDRLVAIKLLPPERAREPRLRERFLREAQLAARLSHPNIIPIHSVEEENEFVFFVMTFIDGETLAERVRTRGPLTPSDGARLMRDVAWALAYAHEHGVIHRDVKPDNILIERATSRVFVADFGIAAAIGTAPEEAGLVGTPEFMAPEQVLGEEVDARTDLYAWGATAFFGFTGRYAFEGKDVTTILAKHVAEPPPPLAGMGISVPRKLAAIVDRCLSKNRRDRPADAQTLAEQISAALENRRDLPAALRAFVNRSGRMDGAGALISGVAIAVAGAAVTIASSSMVAGFTTIGVGAVVVPGLYMIGAARQMFRQGFMHRDLAPAFNAEKERAEEELSIEKTKGSTLVERVLPKIAVASWSIYGLWYAINLSLRNRQIINQEYLSPFAVATISVTSLTVGVLATIGWLSLRQRHTNIDVDFWGRLWLGAPGRLAFALAKKLHSGSQIGPAMTHRPTELALGLAADQLFEALPRVQREQLGELPGVLQRLQHTAQQLRQRHDALHQALSEASSDGRMSDEYAVAREQRDALHTKLKEAIGALESIRLNLLRLHAGSGSIAALTTQVGAAAEVSEQLQRLLGAQDDVERVFDFPRGEVATPV